VSPSALAGPRRFFPRHRFLWRTCPPLDAVVVSHDHYDHLDMATIRALSASGAAFYVPLGVGAHLERWNVPAERIHEFDWNESARVGPLTLTLAAARHFSGRGFRNRNGDALGLLGSWPVPPSRLLQR
jgi:L-ascorbate metabolism protein UlaG (beta-lactamase superfamily)